MFQFPTFAPLIAVISLQLIGFPHSDIHGSIRICQSPWLFAACHVLLRLQEPRHPPCTLSNFSRSLLYVFKIVKDLFFPLLGLGLSINAPLSLIFRFGSAKLQLFSQLPNFFHIFYASGKTETYDLLSLFFLNSTVPLTKANNVWSLPIPTFCPGL